MSNASDSGLILIDKPEGMTSRQVDNAIQKIFHTRKVGHLGTLDPFATGLLIIAVNKGTKVLPFLQDEEKTYIATLRLGQGSSTGDKDGELFPLEDKQAFTKAEIEAVLPSFLGESTQIPPMTSAIKVDGTALYKLAHQGKEIEREPRKIRIDALNFLSLKGNDLTFITTVSKGTYIRVLGEDIAKALGSKGHLIALRRVKIGDVSVDDAIPLEKANKTSLLDPAPFLSRYRTHVCSIKEEKGVRNGCALALPYGEEEILALSSAHEALAILVKKPNGDYFVARGLF